MKMKNKMTKIFAYAASALLVSSLAGCTAHFEDLNTNPCGPTPEQMLGDNASTGALIKNMVMAMAQGQQNNSQMIDQMVGAEYGGCISCINPWGNGGNFYTYNPRTGWSGIPFDTTMPQIYTGLFQIKGMAGENSLAYQWAQVIRVAAALRVSDCYGPIPYSKINGSDFNVAYDKGEDMVNAMFADLDAAIAYLAGVVASGEDMSLLGQYDPVYNGDFTKWVKFANTLKLRIAMRYSNAMPDVARTKAEEAVSHAIGVMTAASDAAWNSFNDGMNPFYRAAYTWNGGELRVSANITSYMSGYGDPRLTKYAANAKNGSGLTGVRNGIFQNAASFASYQECSNIGIAEGDPLLIMSAAEAWLLRAEGALKGWAMNGSAQTLYESGVKVSMEERGVNLGNYLESSATPAAYTDPVNSSNSCNAVSSVTPKWASSTEENLEQIMVQKWLASYPSGWEAWSDRRRTGYPKFLPIVNNLNTDGVSGSGPMARLPYPQSEYNTNAENLKAAVAALGGEDKSSTKLWWAKK